MQTDRRCVQRKRPGGISYLEFEAGRGGIVLDASEKGLGFRAAGAVQQLGPSRIRIWISPRPEERIEITGNVVWADSSNKTGGLRFIETGADSSDQIRTWLWQPSEFEVSPQFQQFPGPARSAQKLTELPEVRRETRHNANLPRSPVASRAKAEVAEGRPVGLRPIPGLPSLFASNLPRQSQDSQASQPGIASRLATGFLIGVLIVAVVVLFQMFRPQVGALLIHLGEKITGTQRQTSPRPSSSPVPAYPSPSTEANREVVQKEASRDSALPPDSPRQVTSESPSLAIPPTKEDADRSADPRSPNSAQDKGAEVTRLWSAVASGNYSAEVDLARLYLRGDGVPQNCEQAKVLLQAAAKHGRVEAQQQLKELRTSGCPLGGKR